MSKLRKLGFAITDCAALSAPSAFAQPGGSHDVKPMTQKNMDKVLSMHIASQKTDIAEFDRWLPSKAYQGEGGFAASKQ